MGSTPVGVTSTLVGKSLSHTMTSVFLFFRPTASSTICGTKKTDLSAVVWSSQSLSLGLLSPFENSQLGVTILHA